MCFELFFFFNAALSIWKWCWPFSCLLLPSFASRMTVWRKRWHIQVPPSTLVSLSWEISYAKAKLLTTEFIVGKHKTTVSCQFFLLVLLYPRPYLWNQTEFINEQMYLSHFPLPPVIQWTQFACIFEISLFSSSYNSLLYMRSFQSKVWKCRLSSHHDQERQYNGNTGSNVDLTGICGCTECWNFDPKQLKENLQICKMGQWYKCWSH